MYTFLAVAFCFHKLEINSYFAAICSTVLLLKRFKGICEVIVARQSTFYMISLGKSIRILTFTQLSHIIIGSFDIIFCSLLLQGTAWLQQLKKTMLRAQKEGLTPDVWDNYQKDTWVNTFNNRRLSSGKLHGRNTKVFICHFMLSLYLIWRGSGGCIPTLLIH